MGYRLHILISFMIFLNISVLVLKMNCSFNDISIMVPDSEICQKKIPYQQGRTCLPISVYPYYKTQCLPPCSGTRCQNCYSIPALFAEMLNITLADRTTIKVPSRDGWIVSLVLVLQLVTNRLDTHRRYCY